MKRKNEEQVAGGEEGRRNKKSVRGKAMVGAQDGRPTVGLCSHNEANTAQLLAEAYSFLGALALGLGCVEVPALLQDGLQLLAVESQGWGRQVR